MAAEARHALQLIAGDDIIARFGLVPTIEVRESSRPNAYAISPARIVLTSALFDAIQNSSELAFVLAHEVGHLVDAYSKQSGHLFRRNLRVSNGRPEEKPSVDHERGQNRSDGGHHNRASSLAARLPEALLSDKLARGDIEEEIRADCFAMRALRDAELAPLPIFGFLNRISEMSGKGLISSATSARFKALSQCGSMDEPT